MDNYLFDKLIQKGSGKLFKLGMPFQQFDKLIGSYAVGVVGINQALQFCDFGIKGFLLRVVPCKQFGKVLFGDFVGGVGFVQLFEWAFNTCLPLRFR